VEITYHPIIPTGYRRIFPPEIPKAEGCKYKINEDIHDLYLLPRLYLNKDIGSSLCIWTIIQNKHNKYAILVPIKETKLGNILD